MAVVKKKLAGEIKEYVLEELGLDKNGCYKIKQNPQQEAICLKPDGSNNNNAELKYTCSSTVNGLLEDGKTVVYSDDAETHNTWDEVVRDGILLTPSNDIMNLGYINDHAIAGLGDDFVEIQASDVQVHGDDGYYNDYNGGIDVIMIRCGGVFVSGNGNSDHYFVNINEGCKQQGAGKNIIIKDVPFDSDANKLHLCNFSFQNSTQSAVKRLESYGIHFKLTDNDLAIYLEGDESNAPDITVNGFCKDAADSSVNHAIAAIVDRNGFEISLQKTLCDPEYGLRDGIEC